MTSRTTISLDAALFERAKRRMRALGIKDFSSYVETLLWNDVNDGGPLPRALAANVVFDEPSARVAEEPHPALKKKTGA